MDRKEMAERLFIKFTSLALPEQGDELKTKWRSHAAKEAIEQANFFYASLKEPS